MPYDIFHLGANTLAAIDFLQTPAFITGFTEQSVVGATLSADLGMYGWRLPWAKDGIGVAFGLERRTEKLELHPDEEYVTADLTSFAGPTLPINGRYTVKEAYAEVKVPLIQDRPFAQLLSVNGSYRYSDYNTGHTTDTYGIGAEWAPVKEIRLRGSYQKATRAANIIELFLGQGLNLFNMSADPCGTSSIGGPPTATLAQCLLTGLKASQYGSGVLTNVAGQYNYLQGGNPNLDPEQAKTYTLGAVWQPMRNLSASVDYFKIKLDKVVSRVPPPIAVSQCIATGQFCDLIPVGQLQPTYRCLGKRRGQLRRNLCQGVRDRADSRSGRLRLRRALWRRLRRSDAQVEAQGSRNLVHPLEHRRLAELAPHQFSGCGVDQNGQSVPGG